VLISFTNRLGRKGEVRISVHKNLKKEKRRELNGLLTEKDEK